MMINCHKATELLSASRERPLTRWERLQLGFHNLVCRLCRQFGHDLENLGAIARTAAETEPYPRHLSQEAKSRISSALSHQPDGNDS